MFKIKKDVKEEKTLSDIYTSLEKTNGNVWEILELLEEVNRKKWRK